MYNMKIGTMVLGIALLLGCAGRTTEKTTYDEAAEHPRPESPKVEADDLEHEYHEHHEE